MNIVIIGAGGIGFDVAEFLIHRDKSPDAEDPASWLSAWGVADPQQARGGVVPMQFPKSAREVTLMQRSGGKLGAKLGKTTGWIHRSTLKHGGVAMVGGLNYDEITDNGVKVSYASNGDDGGDEIFPADNVILCAGQVPKRELYDAMVEQAGSNVHLIGGAHEASELDAKRAINQGSRLAAKL